MAMLDVVEACAGGGSGVGCVTVFVAAALLVAGCSQVPVESVDEPVAEEPGVERDEQPEPDPPPEEPSSESEGEAEPALGDPEELEDESASPDEVRAQEVEIPPVEIPLVEQLGFTWDVRDGVAKEELEFIEIGIALGVGYSEAFYGGAIPHDDRSQFTVMVVADGAGDALIGGGGFCCSWKPESSTVFLMSVIPNGLSKVIGLRSRLPRMSMGTHGLGLSAVPGNVTKSSGFGSMRELPNILPIMQLLERGT